MLSRIIKALYHFTFYTVAVIVLIAAVSVSLIRLALPDIGEYRGEIEAWVSHYMGFPVVIRSIDATWKGWTPHLYLTDIDLLNKAGTKPITRFDHARISLNPIATVIKRCSQRREWQRVVHDETIRCASATADSSGKASQSYRIA